MVKEKNAEPSFFLFRKEAGKEKTPPRRGAVAG
jgi:hypothetical protein